ILVCMVIIRRRFLMIFVCRRRFFFSSRRRHTRFKCDWSSDVCSSDLPRFRHRIDAIVERFTEMQSDLDRERKTMMRVWAKREEQLRGVLDSTAGLYGDLQGIAGRAMQEIESLDVLLIEGKSQRSEEHT